MKVKKNKIFIIRRDAFLSLMPNFKHMLWNACHLGNTKAENLVFEKTHHRTFSFLISYNDFAKNI